MARHKRGTRKKDLFVYHSTLNGIKTFAEIAKKGRRKMKSEWVIVLYPKLIDDSELLRKARFMLISLSLRQLAQDVLVKSKDHRCNNSMIDLCSSNSLKEHINPLWISKFMASINIVLKTQTGKLLLSPANAKLPTAMLHFIMVSYPETLASAGFVKKIYEILLRHMLSFIFIQKYLLLSRTARGQIRGRRQL